MLKTDPSVEYMLYVVAEEDNPIVYKKHKQNYSKGVICGIKIKTKTSVPSCGRQAR